MNHEEITLSSIQSRHSPKCDTPQIAETWESRICETNHDGQKDEAKIMSRTPHQHRSPNGTLGGQSSKSKKYL